LIYYQWPVLVDTLSFVLAVREFICDNNQNLKKNDAVAVVVIQLAFVERDHVRYR
jgi:hypothetical protein